MGWFVAQTHPCRERLAVENLRRQGFERVLLLTFLVKLPRGPVCARPLFPGYLFVSFDLELDRWAAINSTIGVRRLIAQGERPVALPALEVEALVALYGTPQLMVKEGRIFREGELVRVTSGPLAGHVGLVRLPGPERTKVLLRMLGGHRAVDVRTDQLELARCAPGPRANGAAKPTSPAGAGVCSGSARSPIAEPSTRPPATGSARRSRPGCSPRSTSGRPQGKRARLF